MVDWWMGGEGSVRRGPAGQRSSLSFPVHLHWEGRPTALSQLIQSSATRSHQSAAPSGATALPEAEALSRVHRVALDHQFLRLLTLPWLRIHIGLNGSDGKCKSLGSVLLCDLMGCTVQGNIQARILGWAAFPFSRGSS